MQRRVEQALSAVSDPESKVLAENPHIAVPSAPAASASKLEPVVEDYDTEEESNNSDDNRNKEGENPATDEQPLVRAVEETVDTPEMTATSSIETGWTCCGVLAM